MESCSVFTSAGSTFLEHALGLDCPVTASGCSSLQIQDGFKINLLFRFTTTPVLDTVLQQQEDPSVSFTCNEKSDPSFKSTHSVHCRYLRFDPTLQKFC